MNKSILILILLLFMFSSVISDIHAADCITPGSSVGVVIRPWPDKECDASKQALDRWNDENTWLMSNADGLTVDPMVIIPVFSS